jgi:hypothetical protein
MSQAREVGTRAMQTAVKGREHEVLEALGIRWREGRPHISCPYPDHAEGDRSWRWNERRARRCYSWCRSHGIEPALKGCPGAIAAALGHCWFTVRSPAGEWEDPGHDPTLLEPTR